MILTPEFGGMSGGIGTSLMVLARALLVRGIQVSVVTRAGPQTYSPENFPVTAIRCPEGHFARWAFRAIGAMQSRRSRPDVIHSPEWNAAGFFAAALTRIPVVTRLDTPSYMIRELSGVSHNPIRQRLVERAEHFQAHHSKIILAASEEIGDLVARRWALDSSNVRLLRNPIEVGSLRAVASAPEVLAQASAGVVFSGRLEVRKGIAILLPLVERLLASGVAPVTLVGSTAGLGQAGASLLSSLVSRFPSTLRVLGSVPHAQALKVVSRAELVVVTSLWENAPLVVMEAMAMGIPVIASATGGIPELIIDGRDGILVESRSPLTWFNIVKETLTHDEYRQNLAVCAADSAQRWDAPSIAETAAEYYEEAIRSV